VSIFTNTSNYRKRFLEHTVTSNEYYPVHNTRYNVAVTYGIQLIKQNLMVNNINNRESTRTKFIKIVHCNSRYVPIRQADAVTGDTRFIEDTKGTYNLSENTLYQRVLTK
jgi:hypothetical protein